MAILYANATTGNDSNDGLSPANAKKTLAGIWAIVASNDIIYLTGVFTDYFVPNGTTNQTKNLDYRALGYAAVDTSAIAINWVSIKYLASGTAVAKFTGIDFINAQDYNFALHNGTYIFTRCRFYGATTAAIGHNNQSPYCYIRECLFFNNTSAIKGIQGHFNNLLIDQCIFANNGTDIDFQVYYYNGYFTILRSVFASPIMYNWAANAYGQYGQGSNYNVFDFTNGKMIMTGVDKTTLADFQTVISTSTTGRDRNSINEVPDIGDKLKGALLLIPGDNLLAMNIAGASVGYPRAGYTISNNRNASLWTGGVFSNTEVDGSGHVILSAGQTLGTWASDVVDLGASHAPVLRVGMFVTGQVETGSVIPDSSLADSPNYQTYEVRASNSAFAKGDGSPAWVAVKRGDFITTEIDPTLRYWQVRVTLRG